MIIRIAVSIACLSLISACTIRSNERPNTVTPDTQFLTQETAPSLALTHYPVQSGCGSQPMPVLFIHGATFPGELSVGYKLENQSWADDLNAACFDVWALDFAGYGQSDKYSPLNRKGDVHDVPGRSRELQFQIARAMSAVRERIGQAEVSILAHSWGTIPAGEFAANNPALIKSLIMFGAIGQRDGGTAPADLPPTKLVSIENQHDKFVRDTPADHEPVLDEAMFANMASEYLATDAGSSERSPPSVEAPSGPLADIGAAWAGKFPYDLSRIEAPTLLVRGEWDRLSTDADNQWLKKKLISAKTVVDTELPEGGHLMHFESGRFRLRQHVRAFLIAQSKSDDQQ